MLLNERDICGVVGVIILIPSHPEYWTV